MRPTNSNHSGPWMPPKSPLAFPVQSLDKHYVDRDAPRLPNNLDALYWRLATFLPAFITTGGLIAAFTDWFSINGLSWFEAALIALIALTFFWVSLSLSTVTVGILNLSRTERKQEIRKLRKERPSLNVALLVPVYNEAPADVFGNACAMLDALAQEDHPHRYTLFVLSDTRDEEIALQERRAFEALRARLPHNSEIYYRRRDENTDRKVGNLADWVECWGGGYEAMLVLDADSLMCGKAIVALSDELASNPTAGLIQSIPQLFGAETLFGRMQQFASTIYGAALAEGLAKWADNDGNYWGHNAIIRTKAFAACAGLPKLNTLRSKSALILSHDFVEAGLLRRAGWGVYFVPRVKGSYEEVPATLVDYVLRDRRWCQGNLQHLNILGSKGFRPLSRFHMFHGAMGYLLSPAWFILLLVWALIGKGQENNVIQYFSGSNPQVLWPEISYVSDFTILVFMYSMLLAPKVMGALSFYRAGLTIRDLGGAGQFALSFVIEIIASILYAPILMIQQTIAVARTVIGYRETWSPQARKGGSYSWATLAKFHALETVIGIALMAGLYEGIVTFWLIPIAVSLALAIPLSALSGVRLTKFRWSARQLGTQEVFNIPDIMRRAKVERSRLRSLLERSDGFPAE